MSSDVPRDGSAAPPPPLAGRSVVLGAKPAESPDALARLTLDSIGDAVISTDATGHVVYLNAAAERATGWPRAAAAGRPFAAVFRIMDRATGETPLTSPMALALAPGEPRSFPPNSVLIARDGAHVELRDAAAAPLRDADGRVIGAVLVCRDAGRAHETAPEASHPPQHDLLTGLPNVVLLDDRLSQAIARARRHDTQLAVLCVGLDRFTRINHAFGRAVGDELLQWVGLRLERCVRSSDTVCRSGGDEFVVLLAEIAHADDAARGAAKLIAALAEGHRIGGRDVQVTASIGIGIYPLDGDDAEALLVAGDGALGDAKRNGRNRHWFARPEMNPRGGVVLKFPLRRHVPRQ